MESTVEELEIIIKAKIDDALKGIKTVTNGVKEAVKQSVEPVKQISTQAKAAANNAASSVNQLKQVTNEYKTVANSTQKQQEMLIMKIKELKQELNTMNGDHPMFKSSEKDILSVEAEIEALENKLYKLQSVKPDVDFEINTEPVEEANGIFARIKQSINDAIVRVRGLKVELDQVPKKVQKIKKSTTDVGKVFTSGIKSLKRFAMSLLSIRTAFTAISRASQAYLSFDTQLQDSIQNSWNMLGSLLAPVLEYVAALFNKVTTAIATMVKALTGIDLVARANKKALESQAKAAQKATGLSSIDDISTLSSSSGNTQKIEIEEIDESPFIRFADKLREIFSTIFEPFRLAWEESGTSVIESIKTALASVGEFGASVWTSFEEVWTNGTGQEIVNNFLKQLELVLKTIGNIASAIKGAWEEGEVGTSIFQNIADIFVVIQQFSLDIWDSIEKWTVSESFQTALNRVFTFINDIFGVVKEVAQWVLSMYEKYLKPVIDDKLLPAIDEIIIAISDVWNAVKPVVNQVIKIIETVLEPVIADLTHIIGAIIDVIRGIAQFVSGVFTGDWKKAWEGVKTIFKGIWDSLGIIVRAPINAIITAVEWCVNKLIDGWNALKKAINKLSIDIPDWLGGGKLGFNLKMSDHITIPRLEKGNVAYRETLGVFGEYANAKTNPEITAPQSIIRDTLRQALDEFAFNNERSERLTVQIGDRTLFDDFIDYVNEKIKRGVKVFKEA